MSDFTGLLPESLAQKNAWKSSLSPMPVCAPGDLVDEVLWDKFPEHLKIKQQGMTNSCCGHGTAHAAMQAAYCQSGVEYDLSPWWCYIEAQRYGGNLGSDSGAYLGGACKAVQEIGIAPAKLAPNTGRYYTKFPPEAGTEAAKIKVLHTVDLESGGYDALRLLLGQQMGAGIYAVSWPIAKDNDGNVEQYRPLGRGGHCMAWVALSTEKDSQGRPWVWCANSHPSFTRYLMSPTAVQQIVDEDSWGCWGVSTMSVMKPVVDWRQREMMA